MITLKQLQQENAEWTAKNFPNKKRHHPLLGIVEEVGELSHAHLKDEQGIRGTFEEHFNSKCDAAADIIIFLCDYCNQNAIDLQDAIEVTWSEVKKRDWTKNKMNGAT